MHPFDENYRIFTKDTVDTTRINTGDPFVLAVWNSNLIYPGRHVPWHPHSAIIAVNSSYHYAMAGASLIHHPLSGTHLLTTESALPRITAAELLRLKPEGRGLPAAVFLVGPAGRRVEEQLRGLGFSVMRVGASPDAYAAAVEIARFRLEVVPPMGETGKKNIILVSGEDFSEALPAPGFAAHMGTPVLFVQNDFLPEPTREFIKHHPDKNYFILGSRRTVSEAVEKKVKSLARGIVDRIGGDTPFAVAVNFSRYHRPEAAAFGWNRNKPQMGDAFNFAPVYRWENAVMSALQSHEGKHCPLLTVKNKALPVETRAYLEFLRPVKPMPVPPFMHGFIQGDYDDISFGVQLEIEKAIIFREIAMENENGH